MVRGRQLCTQLSIFEGSLAELLRTTAACTFFQHLNFQKWSEHLAFCILTWTYGLRATTACTFSTSQLLKVLQAWGVLCATTACTFSTSQLPKVLRPWCVFEHFDLDMCFAPQRRALFRHLNFQECSGVGVYCTFWLGMTWTYASHHTGVEFFISHLPRWLRTRRFSEPTFRSSRATNHWKNTMFCDFYLFACLHLLSCASFSSLLFSSLLWLFLPLLLHLSILSEVWLLNFLR